MANPFKAIGRGIARGAKALVGKGGKGGGAHTFNNQLSAPQVSGGPQRAAFQAPAAPLPNVRRAGGAAGTFTEAKPTARMDRPSAPAPPATRAARPRSVTTVPPTPPGVGASLAPSVQPTSRPVASASEASYFKGARMGPQATPASPAAPARRPLTGMDMTRGRAAQQRARASRDRTRRSPSRSR